MRRWGALVLGVVLLTACGNDVEEIASDNDGDLDESTEPSVEQEAIEEEENPNEENDEFEENGEDTDLAVKELVGEEYASATTKEDQYVQAGTFTGGEMTDGRVVGNIDQGTHDEYERLVFDIYEGVYDEIEDPVDIPNDFEVTKETYPSRLMYTLSGIRGQPADVPDLSNMNLFSQMETVPYFDDASIQYAVYVQEAIEFEIFEMHNPAKIVTDVRQMETEEEYTTVYSLRTASIPEGETVEDIQRAETDFQEMGGEQVRILHAEDSSVFVEEGYYVTFEEAEERKNELEDDGFDMGLHIEERGVYDMPEAIQ
ncbi:hypothetical protein JCM19037_325 [Geomicrobium sp. JCM 19037]|uniref:hypothetical protein n=1 Tax=Geomicrobium sp. JCM 19037 TaxID=1460634 RepID=UPI00045F121D|nr:hypothetical protein [Geomicrobium sp. JCM 19037]GAK02115.1 hypothetical protein JCM19037_325 [Geomicrobium sp. JCM 19037]